MKIIVTGGAGFIGSALCRYLIDETDDIILNIDKLTYAANLRSLDSISENPRYQFEQIDICNREALDEIFETFQPDAIFHLAAESHVDRSITGAADFMQTNIIGSFNMLEAARAYWSNLNEGAKNSFRFLHVSTDEVYGSLGDEGLFREDTPFDPSSPYSASKAASDHLAISWFRTYGFPSLISNCSNNYGPYQFPEKLIPLMILNAKEGKPLPIYGDGLNVRDWLYVDDHVSALYTVLTKGRLGETYNVGGRNERTNMQVVNRVCELLDDLIPSENSRAELITYVTDRPGHDARYAIDATKLESELGWRAKENFESGMEKTVRWYIDNPDWWQPLRDGDYKGERLGLLDKQSGKGKG